MKEQKHEPSLKWQLQTRECFGGCIYTPSALFRWIARIKSCRFVGCRLVEGNPKKLKPRQRLLSLLQPTTKQRWGMSENLETRDYRCLQQSRAGRTTPPKMADSCLLLLRMRRGNPGKGPLRKELSAGFKTLLSLKIGWVK
ncbi:hypothetical protein ISCGN_008362 [Ixodes scapularis]